MTDLELKVVVDPKVNHPDNSVVVGDLEVGTGSVRYRSLGEFYGDLIQGRSLPLTLTVPTLRDVSDVVLVALFLRRYLSIDPATPGLVMSASLASKGPPGLAHVERDLGVFYRFLGEYLVFPFPNLSVRERGNRLSKTVDWLEDYVVNGVLPDTRRLQFPTPRVLDIGTNGFVVAEQEDPSLWWGWVELFRMGYLRGVSFYRDQFLVVKKSDYLKLDLNRAQSMFREAGIMSELSEHGLCLEGTTVSRDAVVRGLTAV